MKDIMTKFTFTLLLLLPIGFVSAASPSPMGASVYIISPTDKTINGNIIDISPRLLAGTITFLASPV